MLVSQITIRKKYVEEGNIKFQLVYEVRVESHIVAITVYDKSGISTHNSSLFLRDRILH